MAKKATVKNKVNKDEFIELVAAKMNKPANEVAEYFTAFQAVVEELAAAGKVLSLTGIGKFYVQRHKGHPVQFGVPQDKVANYVVYKFSASNVLNEKLREIDKMQGINV